MKDYQAETSPDNINLRLSQRQDIATRKSGLVGTFLSLGGGSRITNFFASTQSVDFGNTGAGAFSEIAITVNGVLVGDPCMIGVRWTDVMGANAGFLDGYVSNADTVTIRFHNLSGIAIDPVAGNISVLVFRIGQ